MDVRGLEVALISHRVCVAGVFCHASCTRLDVFLDKLSEAGPSIVSMNELYCLVLTRMSGEDVVMLVSKNTKSEVV